MKTCPYCGKEYQDDVILCAVDRYTLEPPPAPNSAIGTRHSAIENSSADVPLVFPEYRLTQRHAWMFFAVMVVIDLNWPMFVQVFYGLMAFVAHSDYIGSPGPDWLHMRPLPYPFAYAAFRQVGSFSYNMTTLAYAGICTLAVAYIARTNSLASFCKTMGLDRKPTIYAWFGVLLAVGIRFIGQLIYSAGLTNAYPNFEIMQFFQGPGSARYLFLFPLLYAPFWEEPVYRGFLFKAFRGSYSAFISVVLVIAFTAYMHWAEYSHFGYSAILLTGFTMVQCWLREKSGSLWDCILSHLVFNLTGLLMAGVLV